MEIPRLMYGTAWKEDDTTRLTKAAIMAGFRAIDTACQPKHYQEALVGEALLQVADAGIGREQLFLQTKFTYERGQDHRLPYDPRASFTEQVQQSFACSQRQLHTEVLDSYILHGPTLRSGLTDADWEVWAAMEALFDAGKVRSIGVSNMAVEQLALLLEHARHKPAFVQNRCYANQGWDGDMRAMCLAHQVVYQGFSLLTANPQVMRAPTLLEMAARHQATTAQVVYRFAQQVGMLPLTGTTNDAHMREALTCDSFSLSDDECAWLEAAG